MKKKILLSLVLVATLLVFTGCNKKEETKEETKVGGWDTKIIEKASIVDDDIVKAFDKANDKSYKLVALLGRQVVAGSNFMFLVHDNSSYKVIVVYRDLEGNSKITQINDFDYSEYTNKDVSSSAKNLVGGWEVVIPSKGVALEEKVQSNFDKATEKLTDYTFLPIGVVGTQLVAGTNYAVLAYGTNAKDNTNGIYLLTLYVDLQGNQEITSSAFIDLATYNK